MIGPRSILDTDLYKLTMQQAVCQLYPEAQARYSFINRGGTQFPERFAKTLGQAVGDMASLRLAVEEANFLRGIRFLTPVYVDFLSGYQFHPDEVSIQQVDGELRISITGPWYRTILWEVPLLASISELYYEMTGEKDEAKPVRELDRVNIEKLEFMRTRGISYVDFGTRRRFSYENQKRVIEAQMWAEGCFKGTSNVHFAMMLGLTPVGTQAHEWFQFHGAKYGFRVANSVALGRWVDVYHGDLGIALTDTFGTPDFFRSFDMFYAKLHDGVRHDSGDPLAFADRTIRHYEGLRIDPLSKTIVFSDSLNLERAEVIHRHCQGRIKPSFGIGTFLTNDVGVQPLNMVIKMVACDPKGNGEWMPAIKLSDDKGKHTGDPETVALCEKILYGGDDYIP